MLKKITNNQFVLGYQQLRQQNEHCQLPIKTSVCVTRILCMSFEIVVYSCILQSCGFLNNNVSHLVCMLFIIKVCMSYFHGCTYSGILRLQLKEVCAFTGPCSKHRVLWLGADPWNWTWVMNCYLGFKCFQFCNVFACSFKFVVYS